MLFHKLGARGFWTNRLLRIGVTLIVGWVVLWPLIMAIWGAGMNKFFGGHIPAMPPMPKVAGAFPLAHLWFLYQLLLLYVAVTVVRAVGKTAVTGNGRVPVEISLLGFKKRNDSLHVTMTANEFLDYATKDLASKGWKLHDTADGKRTYVRTDHEGKTWLASLQSENDGGPGFKETMSVRATD